MPIVKVIRKGVVQAVRKVPTSTCAVTIPMTLDRVGAEVKSDEELPTKVESVAEAFQKFQPKCSFVATAGEEEAEYKAEFQFRDIKDFHPDALQKRQESRTEDGTVVYSRNDLADLKAKIDLLYRIKDRWKLPAVRRAWDKAPQRKQIIEALGSLREELQKVAPPKA